MPPGPTSSSKSLATLTIWGRLRDTRHLAVFFGFCALFLTFSVLQATRVHQRLNGGSIGFDVQRADGPLRIGYHHREWWPELQSGDELLTLDGQVVDGSTFFDLRTAHPVGPVVLGLKRDGRLFTVVGEVKPLQMVEALTAIARWTTGMFLFLLGVGAFLLNPGARLSWLFLFFLGEVGAMVTMTQGLPLFEEWSLAIIGFLFATTPVVGLHFFALLPSELPIHRWAKPLFVVALIMVVTTELAATTEALSPLNGFMEPISQGFTVTIAFLALATIVEQRRRANAAADPRLINMTSWLLIATLVGLIVPLLANTTVRRLGLDGGISDQLSAVSVCFFGIVTAAILVRHNPLQLDRYAASVVGYVLTLGGLGAVFVVALATMPRVLRSLNIGTSSEALVLLTALTVAAASPVYRRARQSVDRWFSRQHTDGLQTTEVLRRTADAVQNEPRELSLKHLVEAALVVGADHAELWQLESSGARLQRVHSTRNNHDENAPVPREGAIRTLTERAGGVASMSPVAFPPDAQQALWDLELVLCAPVRAHGIAIGFLGLGRKRSGFGYRNEDLAFLEALASQAGLALERSDVVTRIGRYRVEKLLARGGMAEVFLAWQLGPGGFERKVALKRLLPELAEDPRSAAGLLDEARITASLQHPHIAQVFEVGLDGDRHFIAMEFIEGPNLRTLIANHNRMGLVVPLPIALAVAQGLLAALAHAHGALDSEGRPLKIVHRDVTPANVLVSHRGEAKLVDFGLVMATQRLFRTETGVARGTVPYMSPEQAAHESLDQRADGYSAGATLFELFTGMRPFPNGPTGAQPPRVSVLNPDLPRALDAVFICALKGKPDERFPTAQAMWHAMEEAAATAPASAAVVGAWAKQYEKRVDPEPVVVGTESLTRNDRQSPKE